MEVLRSAPSRTRTPLRGRIVAGRGLIAVAVVASALKLLLPTPAHAEGPLPLPVPEAIVSQVEQAAPVVSVAIESVTPVTEAVTTAPDTAATILEAIVQDATALAETGSAATNDPPTQTVDQVVTTTASTVETITTESQQTIDSIVTATNETVATLPTTTEEQVAASVATVQETLPVVDNVVQHVGELVTNVTEPVVDRLPLPETPAPLPSIPMLPTLPEVPVVAPVIETPVPQVAVLEVNEVVVRETAAPTVVAVAAAVDTTTKATPVATTLDAIEPPAVKTTDPVAMDVVAGVNAFAGEPAIDASMPGSFTNGLAAFEPALISAEASATARDIAVSTADERVETSAVLSAVPTVLTRTFDGSSSLIANLPAWAMLYLFGAFAVYYAATSRPRSWQAGIFTPPR